MKVSFFIDRPVFSAVISIVIVIVGIIGLTMLPVDQYPQITPPVVKISASYPGASALTVSQAVATPIEQEINGTPGMLSYGHFRRVCRPGFGCRRNTEPCETSGEPFASRSDSERYFCGKAGSQPIDDYLSDFQ